MTEIDIAAITAQVKAEFAAEQEAAAALAAETDNATGDKIPLATYLKDKAAWKKQLTEAENKLAAATTAKETVEQEYNQYKEQTNTQTVDGATRQALLARGVAADDVEDALIVLKAAAAAEKKDVTAETVDAVTAEWLDKHTKWVSTTVDQQQEQEGSNVQGVRIIAAGAPPATDEVQSQDFLNQLGQKAAL